MPSLTVVTGEQAGKQFVLAKRPLSIGRDPARDIQITDPKVSRKHALLRRDGDSYVITPAKALNGVIINGKLVDAETVLNSGDEITLGDTVLRFDLSEDPARTNALLGRKAADRQNRDRNTLM